MDEQTNYSGGKIPEWMFLLLLSLSYGRSRSRRKHSHLAENMNIRKAWKSEIGGKAPLSHVDQTCSSTGDGSDNAAGTFVFDIYTLCTLAYLSPQIYGIVVFILKERI